MTLAELNKWAEENGIDTDTTIEIISKSGHCYLDAGMVYKYQFPPYKPGKPKEHIIIDVEAA